MTYRNNLIYRNLQAKLDALEIEWENFEPKYYDDGDFTPEAQALFTRMCNIERDMTWYEDDAEKA